MTRIVRTMRAKRPAKRVDVTMLREALKDSRLWASLGTVVQPDDGAEHWEMVTNAAGVVTDIMVEVLLVPANVEVTARLAGLAGGRGVLTVPSVGDEVLVTFPDGRLDFMPTLVAVMSSGQIPNPDGQGPAPTTTLILNTKVLIHDGDGGAEPLATKAELDAHVQWAQGHTHAGLLGGTGSVAALTSPPASSPAGTPDPPPTPTGTEVLWAK